MDFLIDTGGMALSVNQMEAPRDPRTAWSAHRSVRFGAKFFGFIGPAAVPRCQNFSGAARPGPGTNRLWCVDPWFQGLRPITSAQVEIFGNRLETLTV